MGRSRPPTAYQKPFRPFGAPEASWSTHTGVYHVHNDTPPPSAPRLDREPIAYGWDPKLAFVKYSPKPADPQPPALLPPQPVDPRWLKDRGLRTWEKTTEKSRPATGMSQASNVSLSAEEHARLMAHKTKLLDELQAVEGHLAKIESRRASRASSQHGSRPPTGH